MRSSTATAAAEPPALHRARPLLGTIVAIRIADAGDADPCHAIDAAFAEIARVHRLMSFQEEASELNLANRDAAAREVALDPLTRACLAAALEHAAASGGAFDPVTPASGASWRDIALTARGVRYARPLAIDLSGIAKGFAVDRACAVLAEARVAAALVNAGGDLRAFGAIEERIALCPSFAAVPAHVALAEGALASSDPALARGQHGVATHYDGRGGVAVGDRFASVAAPRCIDADALTKVVLALGDGAAPMLARRDATAWLHDERGWRTIRAPEPPCVPA